MSEQIQKEVLLFEPTPAFGLQQQAHPVELGGYVNTTCLFIRTASCDTAICQNTVHGPMVGLGHLSKKVHASSGVDLEE